MSRLHFAARRGRLEDLLSGIAEGLNVDERTPHHFTPLHLAAQEGHAEIASALIAARADIRAAHPNGRTALHFAASGGHLNVVRVLIDAGVEPDLPGGKPYPTAALEAAVFNRLETVRFLLDHGADPHAVGREGRNVTQWLEVGGIQGLYPGRPPLPSTIFLRGIRRMMGEASSVEEYAAHHGRRTLIFNYGLTDLSSDPEADAWAKRYSEILGSPDVLAECEDRFLEGDALAEAQKVRERQRKAEERRARRRLQG